MTQPLEDPSTTALSLDVLNKRAELLRHLREFFWQRGFIEIETPLLSDEIIPELHIEPMRVVGEGYLQSSPEMHMKRLLAAGVGNIFQVTRSFRAGERGPLHNPEFAIVEWYRIGDDMTAGMDLLDELMQELLGTPPAKRTTYAEAFQSHVGICPHSAANDAREHLAQTAGFRGAPDRDELLNFLLATRVEPALGGDRPEILYHYPSNQASLANTVELSSGHVVAERFELYYRGIELANGFHELTDAAELRRRFVEVNELRSADGRPALPLPERLLTAMVEPGLPPCTGCALGFDRLAMLAHHIPTIDEVIVR